MEEKRYPGLSKKVKNPWLWGCNILIKIGNSSFSLFLSWQQIGKECRIKVADDWIRTGSSGIGADNATTTGLTFAISGSGCSSVGRAFASNTRGPRFESSHRQLILNQYFLLTICRKDKNKEKEAPNGPFKKPFGHIFRRRNWKRWQDSSKSVWRLKPGSRPWQPQWPRRRSSSLLIW